MQSTGSVTFTPVVVRTSSVVNSCQAYSYHPTILEEEPDFAVKDVNGLVLHTSPVSHYFTSHAEFPLLYYHLAAAPVCGVLEQGIVLEMGGSQKSTGGKLLYETTAVLDGESERFVGWTNSPKEEEMEKYVRYTFATDTPDGCTGADWNGWYSREALAYFSGGGTKQIDTLTPADSGAAMESGEGAVGGFSRRFMIRNLGLEEHRLRSQKEEFEDEKGVRDFLSRYPHWEQNDAALSESEGSYEAGSSPIFDESLCTSQLEAELRQTSEAIEEMEGKMAVRLMVAEAVLRGIVRAVEVDATEAVEITEAELLKVELELQEKDSTVIELISTLKKKEEELVKLVDEGRRKERRLVMDMVTERERILGKIQESEKYVTQKEKELLKMAEQMVELSLNLAAETKRVDVLENQINESKEAESRKGEELLAMMEKAEQFRSEKESTVEAVRREARLKELSMAESLASKEEAFNDQLEKIKTLETVEKQLSQELHCCKERELQLTETLAEKEKVLAQQKEALQSLEATERSLRKEMDLLRQKVVELSVSLSEKDKLMEEQLGLVTAVEIAHQKLNVDADFQSQRELDMSEALAAKERALLEQLEKLSDSQRRLREEFDNISHREQDRLQEKEKVIIQHLETIKSLESSEQQLQKELHHRTQKEEELSRSLLQKENLLTEHARTISGLKSAEAELTEKLSTETEKLDNLSGMLSAKDREVSELLESLRLIEEELKSGDDTTTTLHDLRETVNLYSDTIKERDRSSELLHDEIQLLKSKIEELSSVHASLLDETVSHKAEIEKLRSQLMEKEAAVQDSESRCEELIRREKRLQEKLASMNEEILACKSAAQSAQDQLNEQTWRHETEIALIMATLDGGVAELSLSGKYLQSRCEELTLRENQLQEEVASMNEMLLASKEATQLAQNQLNDQTWRHETEIALIMATLEGSVPELSLSEKSLQFRCEELTRREKRLQEEVASMNEKLVACKDATHLAQEQLSEETWRHETETALIMATLEEGAAELSLSRKYLQSRCEEFIHREKHLQEEVASMNEKLTASKEATHLAQDQLTEQTWRQETEIALIMSTLEGSVTELALSRKDCQEETASLSKKMLEYEGAAKWAENRLQEQEDAAKLAEDRLQEETWKHEIETDFIITMLEGGVADLERDITLLGEGCSGNQAETETFRSRALQSQSLEMNNLRRAICILESKLADAQAASEMREELVKSHQHEVENKDLLLRKANLKIAQLEEKLIESEGLFQEFQREVSEMKVQEQHLKKQKQALESELEQGKRSVDYSCLLEQELRQKVSQLETQAEESEEEALRFQLENVVTSSYLESSAKQLQNLVTEVNKQSSVRCKEMARLKFDVQAAAVELSKSKSEVDRLRSELSACEGRMQSILDSSSNDLAETRSALQTESSKSERLEAIIRELQDRLEVSRNESEAGISLKEKEVAQMALRLEEASWRSEVETMIVMILAEGSAQKLLQSLGHASEQVKIRDDNIDALRRQVEELSQSLKAHASENSELKMSLANKTQELCDFRRDSGLQNSMQNEALALTQAQFEDARKEIEELMQLKSTLLGKIQEQKESWVQMEEALAEEKWKHKVESEVISTVMSEAVASTASRIVEMDSRTGLPSQEEPAAVDKRMSESDNSSGSRKQNPARAKTDVRASKASLSKIDLLLRENDELHVYIREKEELLSQKTEEVFKLKREFYKELEKLKVERRREYESDSSQESPNSWVTSKLWHHSVAGHEVKQNGNHPKLESAASDERIRLSEATALWNAEKSSLQASISKREDKKEAPTQEISEKLELPRTDHERKVSEMLAVWEPAKATLRKSHMETENRLEEQLNQDELNDETAKIEDVAADQSETRAQWESALLSEMRSSWDAVRTSLLESLFEMRFSCDAEKFTLEESLSAKDDKIEELLTKLATQGEAERMKAFEKLQEVQAEHDREVSAMRAAWDAEKVALQESLSDMRSAWDAEKSTFRELLREGENEIMGLLTTFPSQAEPQKKEASSKRDEVAAEHDGTSSDIRAALDAEKSALQELLSWMRSSWDAQKCSFLELLFEMRFSSDAENTILQELLCEKDDQIKELSTKLTAQIEGQQKEDHAKVEEVLAEYDRKLSDMRAGWDREKSTLQESLSLRDDKIKELLSHLSQSEVQKEELSAELQEVIADYERKVLDMKVQWDAEKSFVQGQMKELVSELNQVVDKEREARARRASSEEELSAIRKEVYRLEAVHEEEMERSAAVYRSELDVKTRKLIQAVKDAEKWSEQVRELNQEVRQVKDEASALKGKLSSVCKQVRNELAKAVQIWTASFFQLEKDFAQRTEHYNLRLQRAYSLLSHLVMQCKLLVSKESEQIQTLQDLQKAEKEVDLLGDENDGLMGLLEMVYTVVTHYQPVIQHYPGLADLAKEIRKELLQRLRDPDGVSL
ncbi:hypothetical protein R1sor_010638 [Riccia sorocarpa]|uniref:Uncharacterized protein n=1 Tax=Riccia sorocarpa TaxID=122646 RepID=A0ABD3I1C0_9MARC